MLSKSNQQASPYRPNTLYGYGGRIVD